MFNGKKKNVIIIFALFFVALPIVAYGEKPKANEGGITKRVQHPENQISSGEALNLMMKPGQKQKINVEVENFSNKETIVLVDVNSTRTNGSGGLEYGPNKFKKDKTMKYSLTDVMKAPSELKVPAKSTAILTLDISMPETTFDGIILGGVRLMEKDQNGTTKDSNGGMIVNKLAYLFGVTLRMTDKKVSPNFELRKVKAGLSNYTNAIFVDIGNTQSFLAENMTLNVEITEKGKSDVLYQKKGTDISIAPNSLMSYAVSMDGDRMKKGDYTANIVLKGYDKEWKWKKNFVITDEEADKFNQQDPYLVQERGLNWKLVGLIVGGVLLFVIIIVVILKVTKKKPSKKGSKKSSKRK